MVRRAALWLLFLALTQGSLGPLSLGPLSLSPLSPSYASERPTPSEPAASHASALGTSNSSASTPSASTQSASALIADISVDNIGIATNFTGEKLLMFGSISGTPHTNPDIVITIRGPTADVIIRKKQKTYGIWTNAHETKIGPVPAFYAVLSSRPLSEIAAPTLLADYELGVPAVRFEQIDGRLEPDELADYVSSYKRLKQNDGLYRAEENRVAIVANRLFRAEVAMPSNMPLGKYHIEFHLFENGRLIARQSDALEVDYTGLENTLHSMAYQMPWAYGVVAVILAFFMGWAIGTIFRQR